MRSSGDRLETTQSDDTAQTSLYISGGFHITDPDRRIKEIEDAVGDVDTVFAEAPRSDSPGWKVTFLNLISTPLIVLPMWLYFGLLTGWGKVTQLDDEGIVQHLIEEHGAREVHIDRNVHRLLNEGRWIWVVSHLSIVMVTAVFAVPILTAIADSLFSYVVLLITTALFLGIGLLGMFLAGTFHGRNLQMVRDMENYVHSNNVSSACLVVGGHHEPGIKAALEDSDSIEVVEVEK